MFFSASMPIFRRWTPSAIKCYQIGGDCSRCELKSFIESGCRMRYSVIELVRTLGKPKGIDLKQIEE